MSFSQWLRIGGVVSIEEPICSNLNMMTHGIAPPGPSILSPKDTSCGSSARCFWQFRDSVSIESSDHVSKPAERHQRRAKLTYPLEIIAVIAGSRTFCIDDIDGWSSYNFCNLPSLASLWNGGWTTSLCDQGTEYLEKHMFVLNFNDIPCAFGYLASVGELDRNLGCNVPGKHTKNYGK